MFGIESMLAKAVARIRGGGQGQGQPRRGDGGADKCVCPSCGAEAPHEWGTPCTDKPCPECGKPMVGADVEKSLRNWKQLAACGLFKTVPGAAVRETGAQLNAAEATGGEALQREHLEGALQRAPLESDDEEDDEEDEEDDDEDDDEDDGGAGDGVS